MDKTKIVENKRIKMTKLYDAAYELFTRNGVHNTIIDDIVKHAGVAKGTFYLYCKNKYDLVDKIIMKKSTAVIKEAIIVLEARQKRKSMSFQQSVIFFADYLVDYFENNKKMLELIYKNLSWNLFERVLNCEEIKNAQKEFVSNFIITGGSNIIAKQRLYIIVSMVGSVCYNSVVLNTPYGLEEIKPELYRSIEQILA